MKEIAQSLSTHEIAVRIKNEHLRQNYQAKIPAEGSLKTDILNDDMRREGAMLRRKAA